MPYLYKILIEIIKEEIEKGKEIAIYPVGYYGNMAADIVRNIFKRKVIRIDNLKRDEEKDIISLAEYSKYRKEGQIVVLCASDFGLNQQFERQLKDYGIPYRNMLRPTIYDVPEKGQYFHKLRELCAVYKVIGYRQKRFGCSYDGGYVLLEDMEDIEQVYSFGIGRNITWEEDVADYVDKILCFDHTIDSLPSENKKLFHRKFGIGREDNSTECLLSWNTIKNMEEYEEDKTYLLKMDVEGAEWDFFDTISSEDLGRFRQMTFELHGMLDATTSERKLNAISKIRKTHIPIWVHANNHGRVEKAEGIIVPDLMEITFVNKEVYKFEPCDYIVPTKIDMPNIRERYDVEMGNWGEHDE